MRMRRIIACLALITTTIGMRAQFASAPAFPGAEGFGRYATGGRGGKVIHVTNLHDYVDNPKFGEKVADKAPEAEGTLRKAIRTKGARTIVFDVAGTIDLVCPLKLQNDSVTILGQTAPGDGICLKNYTLSIVANNVIIRYIRCRMGDECRTEDDAMNAAQKPGAERHDIIIDHCSLSWSTDECGSFYANRDFTLQWCILSQSLRNSVHDKGRHGYGGIWGGESAAFHHNLIAHHDSRNPRFDHGYLSTIAGLVDYVNNVVYDWGMNSTYGGENRIGNDAKRFNMIANYYKPGPATTADNGKQFRLLQPTTLCSKCNAEDPNAVVPGRFFAEGNIVNGEKASLCEKNLFFDKNYTYALFRKNCIMKRRALSDHYDFNRYSTISTQPADLAYEQILAYAGASICRDTIDLEVCDDVRQGTARYSGSKSGTPGLIDSQTDVQGNRASAWPLLTGTASLDSDRDGIPDDWESAHGLDPANAHDATAFTLDRKGYYTNLEVYANSLVEATVKAQRQGGEKMFEEYYPEY